MTPRSQAFLEALADTALFAHVGEPLPASPPGVLIGSWQQAVTPERQAAWQRAKLEARGELTSFLAHRHEKADRRWNDLTAEVRPEIERIVKPVCDAIAAREQLPRSPAAAARWDCVNCCMEYEYADLRAPGFYDRLGQLYLLGRFPCGYQGDYPDGILEIY